MLRASYIDPIRQHMQQCLGACIDAAKVVSVIEVTCRKLRSGETVSVRNASYKDTVAELDETVTRINYSCNQINLLRVQVSDSVLDDLIDKIDDEVIELNLMMSKVSGFLTVDWAKSIEKETVCREAITFDDYEEIRDRLSTLRRRLQPANKRIEEFLDRD